ncbi:Hypothetical_protein [Hexamita inflata]|uniref:Hypothetical_protein n=1 Tax=Hexamita inflata TaxID=28002 RepID=A0ABP1GG43_9EUKA
MLYLKVIQKGVEWQSYEKINMFALTCLYISTYKNQFKQQLHHNRGVYAIDFCIYRSKTAFQVYIYPTHLTFVYTGSLSCSKPLRVSKVCSFIQKKRLQKNESMLDSPVPLLSFALQLFLGCSYWAGRFFSLCFKMSSMFSILFRDLIFYQNIPQ